MASYNKIEQMLVEGLDKYEEQARHCRKVGAKQDEESEKRFWAQQEAHHTKRATQIDRALTALRSEVSEGDL